MIYLYVFFIVFGILASLYFYRFFSRIAAFLNVDKDKKHIKALIWGFSMFVGIAGCNPMTTRGIFALHILCISSFTSFINFCLKKLIKNEMSLWTKVYQSGIIPIALTAIIFTAGYFNMNNVTCTHYDITTSKNIRSDGYRIALIADAHMGVSLDIDEIRKKCDEISKAEPDIVVLCGDIVDNYTGLKEAREIFAAFGSIKSTYGIYFVYGNHDRPMEAMESEFSLGELNFAIESSGIEILKDEIKVINGEITLVGREDAISERIGDGRETLSALTENADLGTYMITLDHQPNGYDENAKAGIDLVLSGHTHGGQIWPANIIMKVFGINDGVYGKVKISDNANAIITSGFAGWSYPIKTASKAEYVIIDIKNRGLSD